MDIEKVWKGHQAETDSLPDVQSLTGLKPLYQSTPLKKMKKLLVQNMVAVTLCVIFYIFIIWFFSYWQIRVLIGITLIFTLWALVTAWKLYYTVNDGVSDSDLLAELVRNRYALSLWMKVQNRVALFVYPFSITGGYLWGGVMGSGKDVAAFMSKPIVCWLLIVCIVIMTPLAYKLSQWMFKKTFGKVMTQLDENIASLSSDTV